MFNNSTKMNSIAFHKSIKDLAKGIVMGVIRYTLLTTYKLNPKVSGKIAAHLFLTPPKSRISRKEHEIIHHADTAHVTANGLNIKIYVWGNSGPYVILCHGWGGRGSQLTEFVSPIKVANYRVVTFDAPAHGESSGKKSDMFDYANAIKSVATRFGNPYAIVGHSFGAGCTLLALDKLNVKAQRIVLISCFASSIWVTDKFSEYLGVPKYISEQLRDEITRKHFNSWNWADIETTVMLSKVESEVLLIHDSGDKEVPYSHLEALASSLPHAVTHTTQGLGHRRIVRNEECISIAIKFLLKT